MQADMFDRALKVAGVIIPFFAALIAAFSARQSRRSAEASEKSTERAAKAFERSLKGSISVVPATAELLVSWRVGGDPSSTTVELDRPTWRLSFINHSQGAAPYAQAHIEIDRPEIQREAVWFGPADPMVGALARMSLPQNVVGGAYGGMPLFVLPAAHTAIVPAGAHFHGVNIPSECDVPEEVLNMLIVQSLMADHHVYIDRTNPTGAVAARFSLQPTWRDLDGSFVEGPLRRYGVRIKRSIAFSGDFPVAKPDESYMEHFGHHPELRPPHASWTQLNQTLEIFIDDQG